MEDLTVGEAAAWAMRRRLYMLKRHSVLFRTSGANKTIKQYYGLRVQSPPYCLS